MAHKYIQSHLANHDGGRIGARQRRYRPREPRPARAWGLAAIRERWVENARGIGEPITVNLANGRVEGLFEGIDADGVLLLRTGDGTTRRISSGDLFFGNMTGNAGREPGQEQE